MSKVITCNLSLGKNEFVSIESTPGQEPRIRSNGLLDANEHAAVHIIVEVIRCLSTGKNLDFHFNPIVNEEKDNELIRCRWEKSGRLRIGDVCDKKFMHTDTTTEALARNRAFTCYRRLLRILPRRRPVIKVKPEVQPEGQPHEEKEAEQ